MSLMSDPRRLHPDHAPTPFTVEEIRSGCPVGRSVTARTEAAGEPDRVDLTVFVETDADGAMLVSNGSRHRVTWRELQGHASFPAELTTITEEAVQTPLGDMECLCYRVISDDTASTFWFAKDRPGMPILFTVEENGGLVSTTIVIADEVKETL